MKTPITDAAMVRVLDAEATRMAGSQIEAVHKLYVSPLVARRLETDRAALMEALERVANTSANGFTFCRCCDYVVEAGHAPACILNNALTAARANFPQP